MKYKVMLVDDEPWIVTDLRHLVEWEELGFTIVAEAGTGLEAEKLALLHQPDLIISDIRMPGINGIALLERLRARQYKKLFVFLTAYEDFAYARDAVKLGAVDYILKPVRRMDLLGVLENAAVRLQESEALYRALHDYEVGMLIFELLEQKAERPDIRKRLEQAGLSLNTVCYRVGVVIFHEAADHERFARTLQESLLIPLGLSTVCAPLGSGKWIYLINGKLAGLPGLRRAMRELSSLVARMDGCIGISLPQTSLGKFRDAYREADLMAARSFIPLQASINRYPPHHRMAARLAQLRACSTRIEIGEWIEELQRRGRLLNVESLAKAYNAILQRLVELGGANGSEPIQESELPCIYRNYSDVLDAMKQLLAGKQDAPPIMGGSYVVASMLADIAARYPHKLLIADYAERFRMNASYLSQLFKQEVGESFTDYLLKVRMNKAAELLRDERLSIEAISEQVGYDDHFHFRKMFKKYYQVTPSVYRRKLGLH